MSAHTLPDSPGISGEYPGNPSAGTRDQLFQLSGLLLQARGDAYH